MTVLSLFPKSGLCKDKIRIAATTTTLASLAQEIAGGRAEVYAIASPKRDIHFYSPTPKDVLKVRKADVLIHYGLDLEAWRNPLIEAAGNLYFLGEAEGSVDASRGIALLEVPTIISRAEGDIHLYGNPHYWTDPENGKIIVVNIAEGLARIFPEDADLFRKNAEALNLKLDEKIKDWAGRMAPFKGTAVVTYHRSWPYFTKRFGLVVADELEPKPGIPPTPKHVAELVRMMKEKGIRVIIKESYQENGTPKKIARQTGATVLKLAQHVNETEEASDYLSMIEHNIRELEKALQTQN